MNTYGTTPLRVLLDVGTRIAAIDGRLASELGYDTAELLDAPFSRLLAPETVGAVGADLVALVDGERETATSRRELRASDGSSLPVVLSLTTRTNAAGTLLGFTGAVLVDADHELGAPVLPDHLRHLELAAALIDTDARILDTNMAWGQLFATPAAVLHGSPLDAIVLDTDHATLDAHLDELVQG